METRSIPPEEDNALNEIAYYFEKIKTIRHITLRETLNTYLTHYAIKIKSDSRPVSLAGIRFPSMHFLKEDVALTKALLRLFKPTTVSLHISCFTPTHSENQQNKRSKTAFSVLNDIDINTLHIDTLGNGLFCRDDEDALHTIFNVIPSLETIKHLNLNNLDLGTLDHKQVYFFFLMIRSSSLISLDLRSTSLNNFDHTKWLHFCESIKNSPTLRKVDVENNNLSPSQLQQLTVILDNKQVTPLMDIVARAVAKNLLLFKDAGAYKRQCDSINENLPEACTEVINKHLSMLRRPFST